MFYCKTRFYVPKWRRWLNNDSSQYLDVENATGTANCSIGEIVFTTMFVSAFSDITAGLIEGVTTSPKDLMEKLVNLSMKSPKNFIQIFRQSIISSLPYAGLNSFMNGLVLSPSYV